tara:strand:+ start:1446 stop:1796 length:351 start_codon:yes stop_codon:yes gene_type:complete
MNLFNTIKTNWRDILTGVGLALLCAFFGDALERLTLSNAGTTWLNGTVEILRGLGRFAAANLAGFLIFSIAWPSVNKFSNLEFGAAWRVFPSEKKLIAVIALGAVYLLAASICFAA